MSVSRVMLSDVRCYRSLRLTPDSRPVVIWGPNGAGKTNLLEALSFLSPGRGLRAARLAEVDRRGGGPWAVAAELATPEGAVTIGTGHAAESGRERRVVKIDGKPASSQAALAEILAVVWLTPQMDRLFLDGPGMRRRFLDRLVFGFDPGHAARVGAYDHSRRARARLLREGRADAAWLAVLERSMAEHGVAMAAARVDLVRRLSAALGERAGPFPRPALEVEGTVEGWLGEMPAVDAEEMLCERLVAARGTDADSGGVSEGPHRSDLRVTLAASGFEAEQCSTGEQKAMLIAILLAHARLLARARGAAPILLLDEVAAHLDAERRTALFEEIVALGAQAWLSGTERALFAPLDGRAQFFTVRDATVTEEREGG